MTTLPADVRLPDGKPYVITIGVARSPIPLHVPFVHDLKGFSVFRSRTVKHGHEQFGLHVGYFASMAQAQDALQVIRAYYPTAGIVAAPQRDLGSLENTLATAFSLVQSPATPDATRGHGFPRPRPGVAAAQRYAVQLTASVAPTGTPAFPRYAALRECHLYRIQTFSDSGPRHALRLGFFEVLSECQQVASRILDEYPQLTVVPVSHREFGRVTELAQQRRNQAAWDALLQGAPPANDGQQRDPDTARHLATVEQRVQSPPPADDPPPAVPVAEATPAASDRDDRALRELDDEALMQLACSELLALGDAAERIEEKKRSQRQE